MGVPTEKRGPHPDFPLNEFLASLNKFMDIIGYNDDIFTREERLAHLKEVYARTAEHFSRPEQRDVLKFVPQKKLETVMRTSVQVTVYCWTRCSRDVMTAVSIYYVYIVILDDDSNDPFPAMQNFQNDLLAGRTQEHWFWKLMNGFLPDFLKHYGPFCAMAIQRSTFDYFYGCWIETNQFQGIKGSTYFPLFLRRLNGLGGICGGSLFPAADFDEQKLFGQVATAIAEIEPMVAFVNDEISFYKEFDAARDEISLVNNICTVEGTTVVQAYERVTDMTIAACQRITDIFDPKISGRDPEVCRTMREFVQGYVTWHLCDPRFRMQEVHDAAPTDTEEGIKFRKYFEYSMSVGDYDQAEWSTWPPVENGNGVKTNGTAKTPASSVEPVSSTVV